MPTVAELERTLAHEVLDCLEFPVVARLGRSPASGIDRLADFICEIGPSPGRPAGHRAAPATSRSRSPPTTPGQPLAYVFKTIADPFVGQLSLFKVLSGTIKTDDHLVNSSTGAEERLHGLFHLRGKEQTPADRGGRRRHRRRRQARQHPHRRHARPEGLAGAGARPRAAAAPAWPSWSAPAPRPTTTSWAARSQRLQAEDPSLVVERNEETRQTVAARRRRHAHRGRRSSASPASSA